MSEPNKKKQKICEPAGTPQCSECKAAICGIVYQITCVSPQREVCHLCAFDYIENQRRCPWCDISKTSLTKVQEHFKPLDEDDGKEKEEPTFRVQNGPRITCSGPECGKDATIGYYCCRGEKYKQAHCLECFLSFQDISSSSFADGSVKMSFKKCTCGQSGEFHALDVEETQLVTGQAQVRQILSEVKVLMRGDDVKTLCVACEKNGGQALVIWIKHLMVEFTSKPTLMDVEGFQALLAYLFCHSEVLQLLRIESEQGDSTQIVKEIFMFLIKRTIEPWDLKLTEDMVKPLPPDAVLKLQRIFRVALCYASDINFDARDVTWRTWLDRIFAKVNLAHSQAQQEAEVEQPQEEQEETI